MMTEKKITCIICPIGCEITVKGDGNQITSIEGYACKRGETYAQNEYICPVRMLTSTIKVEGADVPLVAVRSDRPVPKDLLMQCMEEVKKAKVTAPVFRYDILIHDILGSGINIVATGEAEVS